MKRTLHVLLLTAALVAAAALAPAARAADYTNYLENKLADHLFRTTTYTPGNVWVGLMTAASSCETGSVTEVTGGAYARVQVTKADASWKGTHGSASGASSGTGGTITNAAAITFPAPSGANWGVVTHFGIWDASTSGNLLVCKTLTQSKTINDGDAAPSFAIDALSIQVDN